MIQGQADGDVGARRDETPRRARSTPTPEDVQALNYDFVDRRALAALQFVDVTGAPVSCPLAVEAEETTFIRKGGGRVAVMTAPGIDAHAVEFEIPPPPTPSPQLVTVKVDVWPADRALAPRRFSLTLPKTPAPQALPLQPVQIELLPTPVAQPGALVAALAVTVRRASDQRRIEGAVVRFRPSGGQAPARAVTDVAGEALLLIPRAAVAPGEAGETDIAGQLDAFVDPAVARFTADAELDHVEVALHLATPVDPDDIQTRITPCPTAALTVTTGELRTATLAWSP